MRMHPSYIDEAWRKYWDEAHAKNPDKYSLAKIIIKAPDESDLHEITLTCAKTLDRNGAWDFELERHNKETNIISFKYNGTITTLNAVSDLYFHCEYSVKWEFIET